MTAALFDIVNVSRETEDRLREFQSLLEKWNARINLIAPSTVADIWSRHILDSAQLLPLAPESVRTWTDLGTGAGLPGLVCAIIARELIPDLQVTCIEADARKCAFLHTVIRELGLNTKVVNSRIEHASPQNADVISARALAPMTILLDYASRHMNSNGVAILPKGASWKKEVDTARNDWSFTLKTTMSRTDPNAAILCIREIEIA